MRTLHIDREPFEVPNAYITRVNLRDIPDDLRTRAAEIIDGLPMDRWHTLGTFVDTGEILADTAVVRRTYKGNKIATEYGVETE